MTAVCPTVVAARDIDLGQPLNASMVSLVAWPAGSVPEGSFAQVEAVDGRVVRGPVLRGEPVLETRLAPVGTKGGLSAVIGQGNRAITVKVNEVVGVAGFALPGNYVDVLVNTQDDRDRPVSKIVLERILVLAVAQEAGRDDTKPRVVNAVTLEVTPEQAERIDLARSVGKLSLPSKLTTCNGGWSSGKCEPRGTAPIVPLPNGVRLNNGETVYAVESMYDYTLLTRFVIQSLPQLYSLTIL